MHRTGLGGGLAILAVVGAIAVAADEEHWHSGRTDESKKSRLLAAGAEFCIPDYMGIDSWWSRLGLGQG